MKNDILALLESPTYKKVNKIELRKQLGLDASNQKVFEVALAELEAEGLIAEHKGVYDLIERFGFLRGSMIVKPKGFGFFVPEDGSNDVYVSEHEVNGAMNGDMVLIATIHDRSAISREGTVLRVLTRKTTSFVGTFKAEGPVFKVESDTKSNPLIAKIPKDKTLNAVTGHKVVVNIMQYLDSHFVVAEVIEIIGHENDPGVDILSIVYSHGLNVTFSDEVMQELKNIPTSVTDADIKARRDLRNAMTVTIDGADAKDLDDAISYEKRDGQDVLSVHIADVSHYIKSGSHLDKEAYDRATSVYLTDRVIPMIPHQLSNGICSLNEHVDRLTLTCEMTIDAQGNITAHELYPSVIKTAQRLTYDQVNKLLTHNDANTINPDIVLMLKSMAPIAQRLRKKRTQRGSLDFESVESKILIDEKGKVTDVVARPRGEGEMLIEDFMLAANETVATHTHWLSLPSLYRVHERPDTQKLARALMIVRSIGHFVQGSQDRVHPKTLQKLISNVEGKKEEFAIKTLLLRAMMKARYSDKNLGHYGLAADFYTHFTSPIRRYPDLMVHRLLRRFVFEADLEETTRQSITASLPEVARHTSEAERTAMMCERDVSDMKKAEFMENFVGQHYEGIITSVLSFGLFVMLDNTVEGLIRVSDLQDDHYVFSEETHVLTGVRKKRVFRMGDPVTIQVARASKADRMVDFMLVSHNVKQDKKPKPHMHKKNKKRRHRS